ncbi:hypothetical protein Leryth_001289 [Lithospermum erythrorhizon]|nr:hypothetical protein Leryth_001289 [Lithospermum erythrorhizon]
MTLQIEHSIKPPKKHHTITSQYSLQRKMAGTSSAPPGTMTWQVEYARFVATPPRESLRPTHPRLVAGNNRTHSPYDGGQWLKNSTTSAVAKITYSSYYDAVLIISLNHRIMEEHSVMKLHFSWAQMSCASQTAVRGSRAIFASFKDPAGQIQKFAMRFLDASESQSFINTLKRSLKYNSTVGTLSNNSSMNMQSAGRLITIAEEAHVDTDVVDHPHPNTVDVPLQPSFAIVESTIHDAETSRVGENPGLYSSLPPSVANFLARCCTEARQDAAELQKVTDEVHFDYSFTNHMTASSFNAMLSNLDRVIYDLGGDLALC